MAERDTPAHYDSPTKVPPVGSDFEFYKTAFFILDGDPDLPYVWAPIDYDRLGEMPERGTQEMLARINARLRDNTAVMEARIVDDLLAAGFPAEGLVTETRTAEAARLIERLLEAERLKSLEPYGGAAGALDILLRDLMTRRPDNADYCRRITVRVVTAAQFMGDRPKQAEELCAFLNANAAGPRLINRHHLRSVERTFRAQLREIKHARIAQLHDDVVAMGALKKLKETAGRSVKHPHLRSLKGRRLAEAMDAIQDLRQAVFQATRPRQRSRVKAV